MLHSTRAFHRHQVLYAEHATKCCMLSMHPGAVFCNVFDRRARLRYSSAFFHWKNAKIAREKAWAMMVLQYTPACTHLVRPLYHCTTVSLYHCTTVPLYHYTALHLYSTRRHKLTHLTVTGWSPLTTRNHLTSVSTISVERMGLMVVTAHL